MGDQTHGTTQSSSIPMPSRMDRLDSLMKYIEGKQSSSGCGGVRYGHAREKPPCNGNSMPLDLAIRDSHAKGSILDRVALLENRLFQLTETTLEIYMDVGCMSQRHGRAKYGMPKLCLEIEASSTTSSSVAQTSENTSCRQGSTTDQSYSYGSTDDQNITREEHPSCFHRALVNRFEFLGKPMNSRVNSSTQLKHLTPKPQKNDDEPTNVKKLKAHNRRWKRLLGC